MKDINDYPYYMDIDKNATVFCPFKINNGSIFSIGEHFKTMLKVDQHFNWFQKKMWKICFGIKVENYGEE